MRKALVFVAAFALVLVSGAAVALMGSPQTETAVDKPQAVEKPATTSVAVEEKEEPPAEEEPKTQEHKEEPPKDDSKEEPKEEDQDTEAPEIEILHPEDGQHFEKKEVVFEGKTEPGARVFAGKYEADVDAEGNFRIVLILTHSGANTAKLKAIDEAGNYSYDSVEVFYDKAEDEKPEDDDKEVEFWVKQKYGSCGESLPYEKFYGEGAPGTEIWVGNEWGSASTTIGKKGTWDLKVLFPDMPCGGHQIVLETSDGVRKVFEFTHVCGDGDHGDDEHHGK